MTHPTGLARLELRGTGNLVEKHILHGGIHMAARNGVRLEDPRAFLPPLFLLQIDSVVSLRAAFDAFGIQADWVGLAPCDESDCYVLGDPDLAAPPLAALEGPTDEGAAQSDGEKNPDSVSPDEDRGGLAVAEPSASDGEDPGELHAQALIELAPDERPATLWVDMASFDVRRLRLEGGVRVLFGPYVVLEQVRVPSWIQIDESRGSVRFDVVGVSPVNAPASAFDADWLRAPTTSPSTPFPFPADSPDGTESPSEP